MPLTAAFFAVPVAVFHRVPTESVFGARECHGLPGVMRYGSSGGFGLKRPAMPSPRVTVIIATYNGSSVLRYAIDSVLDQTMRDFELLVVGDRCTDDSEQVVAYNCKDPDHYRPPYDFPDILCLESERPDQDTKRGEVTWLDAFSPALVRFARCR